MTVKDFSNIFDFIVFELLQRDRHRQMDGDKDAMKDAIQHTGCVLCCIALADTKWCQTDHYVLRRRRGAVIAGRFNQGS